MQSQLRQRAVGPPAARSVLLTILGEFVLPAGGEAWHETLVSALQAVGYKPAAARRATARSSADNWLESERHGRRSRVKLSPATAQMLSAGAERIYGFGPPTGWDGTWLFALSRVAETRRDVRHRIRTQLAWAGFASLGGGLWISPHVAGEDDIAELAAAEPEANLVTFRSELGVVGDAAGLIAQAWDLDRLREEYLAFIDVFGRARPKAPEKVFAAQTQLVHAWRRFPFVDPQLPASIVPSDWPGGAAFEMFRSRHESWAVGAQDYFASLEAAGDSVPSSGSARDGGRSSKSSRTASK